MPGTTSKTTSRARARPKRAASVPYEPWLLKQLRDPIEAAAYLEAVLEDDDQKAVLLALRQIAQAQGGIAAIARKARLTREATYRMLSGSGNPELRSLRALLQATGMRLSVRPIESDDSSLQRKSARRLARLGGTQPALRVPPRRRASVIA